MSTQHRSDPSGWSETGTTIVDASDKEKDGANATLAKALGWFSVGLGLAELVAPNGLARFIGAPENPTLYRALGVREIAAGVGILTNERPAGWMWSRVGGDAIDLALLGSAFASEDAKPGRLAAATVAVAGVTALDVLCGARLGRDASESGSDETEPGDDDA